MSSAELTKELNHLKRRVGSLERTLRKSPVPSSNIKVLEQLYGVWKDKPVTAKEIREVRQRIWGA